MTAMNNMALIEIYNAKLSMSLVVRLSANLIQILALVYIIIQVYNSLVYRYIMVKYIIIYIMIFTFSNMGKYLGKSFSCASRKTISAVSLNPIPKNDL